MTVYATQFLNNALSNISLLLLQWVLACKIWP